MNIGFDAKRLFNNHTGLGNYSRSLLRNLLEYGLPNEYFLYTPRQKNDIDTTDITSAGGIHTICPEKKKKLWRSFGIARNIRNDGVQLYHGLSNELPFTIKESTAKSVVTIHDLIFRTYPGTYPLVDRKMYDLKFRRSCELADKVVAISQHTKDDIVRFYGIPQTKIEVVYQSCDPIFYHPIAANAAQQLQYLHLPQRYLLYVGSIEPRKNLALVLEALALLPASQRVPLVIVGRGGKYKEKMKELAAKRNLEPHLIWLDNLHDNQQLKAVYTGAAALIYPSLYEGFGLPIVEALLSKTPVITAKTSSLPEAGGPDSLYVHPHDPQGLANAIVAVLQDEALTARMREAGYQYATTHFARQRVTEQLLSLYARLV